MLTFNKLQPLWMTGVRDRFDIMEAPYERHDPRYRDQD